MLVTLSIAEKHLGSKLLFRDLNLVLPESTHVGLIGRNGVGKSTLLGIITGADSDFQGSVTRKRGLRIIATAQEHAAVEERTALDYVLEHVPDYLKLKEIVETYPETMGEDLEKIRVYTDALQEFIDRDYYGIEDQVLEAFGGFDIDPETAQRPIGTLSGGQKRLMEMVKVAFAGADLILLDEPTNHLDYHGKDLFIQWLRGLETAACIITHDRDVLEEVDSIIELRDFQAFTYSGNYARYIQQNSTETLSQVTLYEASLKRMEVLEKQIQAAAARKGKASSNPSKILEERLTREYQALKQGLEKPSFWIDRETTSQMQEELRAGYDRYKARTIRIDTPNSDGHRRQLLEVNSLSVGYDHPLFAPLSFNLRQGDRLMFRGRNGAGKSTLIQALLHEADGAPTVARIFSGTVRPGAQLRVGVYRQEVETRYLSMYLGQAIETVYAAAARPLNEQTLLKVMSDYLFDPQQDRNLPLRVLSGGQKARFQLICMLSGNPSLLVLDEPTNHLDLPSIEELEDALNQYHGAIIYVSHDRHFADRIGGDVIQVGKE